MIDAIGDAVRDGRDLSELPAIFGSAHGETGVLSELLAQLVSPSGALSPVGFASSVHNAASGYYSIATGNRGFTTSIAAGHDTVAACLFEAFGLARQAHSDGQSGPPFECVVVVGDLEAPERLVPEEERGTLAAAAFHLCAGRHGQSLGSLTLPERSHPGLHDAPPSPVPDLFSNHPCAGAWRLIDALLAARAGPVRLDSGRGSSWTTHLTPEAPP